MDGPPPGTDLQATQVSRILGVNIATFILAVLAICLRFIARRLTRQSLWWDDWLMLPAIAAAATMMFVSFTYMIDHGLGRHIWVAKPDAAVAWARGLFVSEISYTCIICSVKFSLLAFYWRLFKMSNIRIPIYVLTGIVSAWGIAVMLVTIFQCQPVNAFWMRFDPATAPDSYRCTIDVNNFFDGNSIPNIITDAAILVLPMPYIWRLQLPRAQKLALSSIFVLGVFVVCVSIARFTFIINLDLKSPDITWNFVNTQVWTAVESHVGITCACLPSLRPMLNLVLFGSINRPERKSADNGSASKQYKGSYSWNSQVRMKKRGDKVGSFSTAEQGEHGFVELTDRGPHGAQSDTLPAPHSTLKNDSGIHVRTDLSVEGHEESSNSGSRDSVHLV